MFSADNFHFYGYKNLCILHGQVFVMNTKASLCMDSLRSTSAPRLTPSHHKYRVPGEGILYTADSNNNTYRKTTNATNTDRLDCRFIALNVQGIIKTLIGWKL